MKKIIIICLCLCLFANLSYTIDPTYGIRDWENNAQCPAHPDKAYKEFHAVRFRDITPAFHDHDDKDKYALAVPESKPGLMQKVTIVVASIIVIGVVIWPYRYIIADFFDDLGNFLGRYSTRTELKAISDGLGDLEVKTARLQKEADDWKAEAIRTRTELVEAKTEALKLAAVTRDITREYGVALRDLYRTQRQNKKIFRQYNEFMRHTTDWANAIDQIVDPKRESRLAYIPKDRSHRRLKRIERNTRRTERWLNALALEG
ncbi:MAG: hypothetical protein LBL91_03480 [Lachnospiraceae bacterium]|jgi:hypothetical protein|nr:hypothetical protein [Lachnospiraceae bacterium]